MNFLKLLPFQKNLGTCEDKDDWCMYGTPDCTNDNIKELCPKTCNICHGNDIFALTAALILRVSDIESSFLHVLSNIETCEDMDEKCTWGIPDCRNSKVVEKCPKTCDACNGKCYAKFVENTNSCNQTLPYTLCNYF